MFGVELHPFHHVRAGLEGDEVEAEIVIAVEFGGLGDAHDFPVKIHFVAGDAAGFADEVAVAGEGFRRGGDGFEVAEHKFGGGGAHAALLLRFSIFSLLRVSAGVRILAPRSRTMRAAFSTSWPLVASTPRSR